MLSFSDHVMSHQFFYVEPTILLLTDCNQLKGVQLFIFLFTLE